MIKGIIFDFGYTIYDPETENLQPDIFSTLEKLLGKYKLALVSRTKDVQKRIQQINELGLTKFFDQIEAIPKEGNKDFGPIIRKFNLKPEEILVVGDRITSEITQGNRLGMKTCRFVTGPEKNLIAENKDQESSYTINKLSEILEII